MTDLYLARQGDTLESVCTSFSAKQNLGGSASGGVDERLKAIEGMNPRFASNKKSRMAKGDMIILPSEDGSRGVNPNQLTAMLEPGSRQNLSEISCHIGGAATVALAYVTDKTAKHLPDLNTFGGGGLGAAATRSSNFLAALDKYDRAIHQFESLRNHRAAPASLIRAQKAVDEAYVKLQSKFGRELQAVLDTYISNTTVSKMATASGGSRTMYRTLPVRTAPIAKSLASFGRYAKVLGPAAIAADGYFRYDTVMDVYNTGGNWKREVFAQSIGFGTGVILGALSFSFLLGPFGWVIGLILAGAAAVIIDHFMVRTGREAYDFGQYGYNRFKRF